MQNTKTKKPGRIKSAMLQWLGVPIGLTDGTFWQEFFSANNFTGQPVTVNTTLQLSAAWACVRLLSETLSSLPMNILVEKDGAKQVDKSHPLYTLLHSQPNADMTAVVFWQAYVASMLLWGNGYAEKRMIGDRIGALDFLHPRFVQNVRLPSGAVQWVYTDPRDNSRRIISEANMFHTPAFTLDGLCGISPIAAGANVFGGARAADEAAAQTFTNGMKAAGIITVDQVLKPGQRDDIREHVKTVSKSGGIFVLEKGNGFHALTMNPQDAELLQTRAFNVEEICRWFGVPPFMVGHAEKSTSWGTGIESQMIGFQTFVLRPWAVRIEQSIRKSLLSPVERETTSAEWAMEGLMRADSAARAAYYSALAQNGVMTRDEIRRLENLPPMGGNAEELTVQSNMLPIDKLGEQNDAAAAQDALKNWIGTDRKDRHVPEK